MPPTFEGPKAVIVLGSERDPDIALTIWRTSGGACLVRLGEIDYTPTGTFEGATTGFAARLVYAAALSQARTVEELAAARCFLRQWREGPQLPGDLNTRVDSALWHEALSGSRPIRSEAD